MNKHYGIITLICALPLCLAGCNKEQGKSLSSVLTSASSFSSSSFISNSSSLTSSSVSGSTIYSSSSTSIHVHQYAETWSFDQSGHWHKAICEHKDLTKDFSAHIDQNHDGYCDTCLYQLIINHYYLPEKILNYRKDGNTLEHEYRFSYDEDFRGYTVTFHYYGEQEDIETYSVRFSDDFAIKTTLFKSEEGVPGSFKVTKKEKYIETLLDDFGSTSVETYEYDETKEEYVFIKKITNKYNSKHQKVLYLDERPKEESELDLYYDSFYEYIYDENLYLISERAYCDDYEDDRFYIENLSEYTYDETYTSGREYSYYCSDGFNLEFDGYSEISITHDDGNRTFTYQNYDIEGNKGNINIFSYDSELREKRVYYGGLDEDHLSEYNEYGQLVHVSHLDPAFYSVEISASYGNEGSGISNCLVEEQYNSGITIVTSSAFTYNDFHQLSSAEKKAIYADETSDEYALSVTYTSLQNDLLLDHMDYMIDVLRRYTHYYLYDK